MAGLGLLFGFVVLVAGLLIVLGMIGANGFVIGLGFLLLALCAIFGIQPGFLGPRSGERS